VRCGEDVYKVIYIYIIKTMKIKRKENLRPLICLRLSGEKRKKRRYPTGDLEVVAELAEGPGLRGVSQGLGTPKP